MQTVSRGPQPASRSSGAARFAHLERLRQMIVAGTYRVDLDVLAARLVEEGIAGSPAS